jgi:methionine-rich copper-binding protein CopC
MKAAASALLGVLLAVIALAAAPTASAHAVRIATYPAVDAVLATGPAQVSATFNEHLQTAFAAMTVVGPDENLRATRGQRTYSRLAGDAVAVSISTRLPPWATSPDPRRLPRGQPAPTKLFRVRCRRMRT